MVPIEDIYKLEASSPVEIEGNEADVNLQLEKAEEQTGGTVTGFVMDDDTVPAPIQGATVKIFSEAGLPLYHMSTNSLGEFAFINIPEGTYYLSASKDGYIMAAGIEITVSESAPVVKVITLTEDAKQNQGTIYGTVTERGTGTPLEDVVVTLFVEDNGSYELISTTVTIDDGEYVLENIDPDTYQLLFSKSGYHAFGPITVEVTTGLSLEESVALDVDPLAATGTISGTIVDDELNPIEGAFVGLYTVSGGASDTLVAITYTNEEGRYLIGDVADGEYIVKAKVSGTT